MISEIEQLVVLKNKKYYRVGDVASFYNVSNSTISTLFNKHKSTLMKDGCKKYNSEELVKLLKKEDVILTIDKSNIRTIINLKNNNILHIGYTGLLLLSEKGVMRLAFLIGSSERASEIRKQLFEGDLDLYYEFSNYKLPRLKTNEITIKNYLEFSFGDNNVKYQVACGKYTLDFVLFNIIHVEVDECGHKHYNQDKEDIRNDYVMENTNYWTIRYNPKEQKPFELIKEIANALDCIQYDEFSNQIYSYSLEDLEINYIDEAPKRLAINTINTY